MAIVIATFDTVEKTLSVEVDGSALADVVEAAFYPSYDNEKSFSCSVTTAAKDKAHDLRKMTRLVASRDGDLSEQTASQKAAEDVSRYFSKNRRAR